MNKVLIPRGWLAIGASVAVLIGMMVFNTPAIAATAQPVPDCADPADTGVLYIADSGLNVYADTGETPADGPFIDESTIQIRGVTLAATGPTSVRLEAVSESAVCLSAVNATAAAIHITRENDDAMVVAGRLETVAFGPIDYTPDADTADLAYRADSPFTVSIKGPILPAGTTVDAVTAGTDRRLATATVASNGTLTLNLPAGSQAVNLRLPPAPGPTADPPEIGISTRVMNFGRVAVGSTETLNVTVENLATTQQNLTVDTTRITGAAPDAFAVVEGGAPFTLGPGERRQLQIAFTPESTGRKEAQLQIVSGASSSQIDVWLTNRRTHVIVQEVARNLSATIGNGTTVNIEGVNVDRNSSLSINLTRPSLTNRTATIERIEMGVRQAGNFTLNVTHASEPVGPDHARYTEADSVPIQYIHLEHPAPESAFVETAFVMRLRKQVVANETDPGAIGMLRYEDGRWDPQSITLIRETSRAFVYRVETDGFSQFVVVGPASVIQTTPEGPTATSDGSGGSNDANGTGFLPFRIPGDPGPEEAAAAGTTISLGWVLRPFLKDIVGTFLIYFERSYRVGDEIEWADRQVVNRPRLLDRDQSTAADSGMIKEIGYRSTLVRTHDNTELSVPNAVLADAVLANLGVDGPLRLQLPIPIDLQADVDHAKETVRAAAAAHVLVLDDPAPSVHLTGFEAAHTRLELRIWVAADAIQKRFDVMDEVMTAVEADLAAAGIHLESPGRTTTDTEKIIETWHQ